LLELYPKRTGMWNDRSYNDHSDHVRFRREKWRGFDQASEIKPVFFEISLWYTSEIFKWWRVFNNHVLWINWFMFI